jgi:hypothetical protein
MAEALWQNMVEKISMSSNAEIRSMLSGGDRRSIGRVAEVVDLIRQHPKKISQVVDSLWDKDPYVSMRAADALEKISRETPSPLQAHAAPLLGLLTETTQQEVRWHLAVILPRLRLTDPECRRVAGTLQSYLLDRSSIVRTFAMQGLADLTEQYRSLRPAVIDLIRSLSRSGTPAMRTRGRKLLEKL